MERNTLEAQRRTATGTKHARMLRQEQRVPGIIYGPKQDPVPFCVDRHDLEVELLHGQRVLSLNLEGQTHAYLIRDIQYNHLGSEFLHLDLSPINLDEKVTLKVAVELRGTPKGATEGGVLDQNLNEIEIECLASDIPTAIKASVANLDVNESLTVGDLKLPDGVACLQQAGDIVATVRVIAEEIEATETEEEETTAPEVITKGKADEEEDAEKKSS